MITPIRPALLGPERMAGESSRAYRAFCYYCDLGPDRSQDLAWQRFRADRGTAPGSSRRRPGYWAAWATRFDWVERAEEHDDLIEQARRTEDAERRRQLREGRARFEQKDLAQTEKLVGSLDEVVDRLTKAPLNEVVQVTRDKVTGKKTTTKIKGLSGRDIALAVKTRSEIARQTIQGYDTKDVEDVERDERKIERIVWMPSNGFNSASPDRGGSATSTPKADLNPDAEEDKAA